MSPESEGKKTRLPLLAFIACFPLLAPIALHRLHPEKVRRVLRGKDVHELEQMKQSGLSVSAISEVTGYDRKTVRKYLRSDVQPADNAGQQTRSAQGVFAGTVNSGCLECAGLAS